MKELLNFRPEYDDYIGTVVLSDSFDCALYLGTFDDDEDECGYGDIYYKLISMNGKVSYSTCVGCVMPLKGHLDEIYYKRIESQFKRNFSFIIENENYFLGNKESFEFLKEIKEKYLK